MFQIESVFFDGWYIGLAILLGTAIIAYGKTGRAFGWKMFVLSAMSLSPWIGGYRHNIQGGIDSLPVFYSLILLMVACRLGLLASWHNNGVGTLGLWTLKAFVPIPPREETDYASVQQPRGPDPQPSYARAQSQMTAEQAIEKLALDAAQQLGVKITAHPDVYSLIARSLPAGADTSVANQLLDEAIRHPLLAARNSGATVVDFTIAADGALMSRIIERDLNAARTPPIKLTSRPINDREAS